jgi:lysophospholipase L1-like esterase
MKSSVNSFRGNGHHSWEKSFQIKIIIIAGALLLCTAITWAALSAAVLRIVVIGDSTASTYDAANLLKGWGQEIGLFFNKGAVTVINKAIGGRSSRSFIEDGHWATTLALLQKGDYLLISFGTNDRGTVTERHTDTAGFRKYLTQYVTESRAKGAIPILVSTVNQNSWSGSTFTEGFTIGVNDYRGAMLRVVTALNVPFVDLEKKTAVLFQGLGQTYLSNFIFDGGSTHFQEMGAINIAKLIAQGIQELSTNADVAPLAAAAAPQYMLTVKANKAGAGMITASGTYPESAPITLKVMPNAGETFQMWQNASAKSVGTQTTYQFTMVAAATTYFAAFKGGTTPVLCAGKFSAPRVRPSVYLSASGKLSISSHDRILSASMTDLSGKRILTVQPDRSNVTLDIAGLSHEKYIVSTRTSSGADAQLLQR